MDLGAARRKTFTLRPGDLAKLTGNGKQLIRLSIRLLQSWGSKIGLSVHRNLSCCSKVNCIDPFKTLGIDKTYLAFARLINYVVEKLHCCKVLKNHTSAQVRTHVFCLAEGKGIFQTSFHFLIVHFMVITVIISYCLLYNYFIK